MSRQMTMDVAFTTRPATAPTPTARHERPRLHQDAPDYADAIEILVLSAECARAYLALEATGVNRDAKLTALCLEVREGLDVVTWERWCRLAGLTVERADLLATKCEVA